MATVPPMPTNEQRLREIVSGMAAEQAAAQTKRMRRALEIIATLNPNTTTVKHARAIAQNCLESTK